MSRCSEVTSQGGGKQKSLTHLLWHLAPWSEEVGRWRIVVVVVVVKHLLLFVVRNDCYGAVAQVKVNIVVIVVIFFVVHVRIPSVVALFLAEIVVEFLLDLGCGLHS